MVESFSLSDMVEDCAAVRIVYYRVRYRRTRTVVESLQKVEEANSKDATDD